jgi:hypothetical protein
MSEFANINGINLHRAVKDCAKSHYQEAAKETLATAVTALLPLIFGICTAFVLKNGAPGRVTSSFFESNSALFVAASLAGPLVYTISKKYGKLPGTITFRFPAGLGFLAIAALVCFSASIMFTLSVAYTGSGDGTASEYSSYVNIEVVRWISAVILLVSFVVLFFVSTVRNMLDESPAPANVMRQDTENFRKQWDSSQ